MDHRPALLAALLAASGPAAGEGHCRVTALGARCALPAPRAAAAAPAPLPPGAPLPEGARLLVDPGYWGLPPVAEGWRYYRVGRTIYRVEAATGRVIEATGAR